MIISISGDPGSGKSTIGRMLAEKLNWPRYYVGELRRKAAADRGMTLEEYNKLGERDPRTDTEVDRWQEELGKKEDNFIIEGRTSWYFIPQSLKIFLKVDPRIAAERMMGQLAAGKRKKESQKFATVKEIMEVNKKRVESDKKRYKKYYNINAYDTNNFDIVIDTTEQTKDETFNQVWQAVEERTGE
jgi:cytidylate kinase